MCTAQEHMSYQGRASGGGWGNLGSELAFVQEKSPPKTRAWFGRTPGFPAFTARIGCTRLISTTNSVCVCVCACACTRACARRMQTGGPWRLPLVMSQVQKADMGANELAVWLRRFALGCLATERRDRTTVRRGQSANLCRISVPIRLCHVACKYVVSCYIMVYCIMAHIDYMRILPWLGTRLAQITFKLPLNYL